MKSPSGNGPRHSAQLKCPARNRFPSAATTSPVTPRPQPQPHRSANAATWHSAHHAFPSCGTCFAPTRLTRHFVQQKHALWKGVPRSATTWSPTTPRPHPPHFAASSRSWHEAHAAFFLSFGICTNVPLARLASHSEHRKHSA